MQTPIGQGRALLNGDRSGSASIRDTATVAAGVVYLLDEDPELAAELPASEWRLARRSAAAALVKHACGEYAFFPKPEPGAIGALVLDGVIVVRTANASRGHVEVMGPGDVISPWVTDDGALTTATAVTASVVRSAQFAYLSRDFVIRIARWPELYAALMHRLVLRARRLSFQAAVNAVPRINDRLEMTLWHLAERFGRVTSDGVAVELPLTHAQLGELVAAQRPSVTSALSRLAQADRVVPAGHQRWMLRGDPPQALEALHRQAGLAR